MTRLAILTPTYRPDFNLFRELHESVKQHLPDDVLHRAIVPARDVALFSRIRSSRLVVTAVDDLLPRRFVSTYAASSVVRRVPGLSRLPPVQAVNVRRPWPPVRGWILQQVVKLAASSQLEVDVALAVDSDVCFIKPVTGDTFSRAGTTRFYRRVDAITDDMAGHLTWHTAAQRMLDLPAGRTARTDYIAPLIPLDPRLVRSLCQRIESVHGQPWLDVMAGEISVSEYILYGSYIDNLAPVEARSFVSESSLCLSRWEGGAPLRADGVDSFLEALSPSDVAVHVQSTAHMDPALRRSIVEAARVRANRLSGWSAQ